MRNIVFILATLLLTFSSCKKKPQKVGGPCEYNTLQYNVQVTFIDGKLDGDYTISFQEVKHNNDDVYRISNEEMTKVKRNFDLNELNNKNNTYKLVVDEITKGTCTPFVIKELLKNK